MYLPEGTDTDQRIRLLQDWQRKQLRLAVAPVIAKWEPIIERRVPRWSIRRMKTKWGSCNRKTGHIWFNVELAKKHPLCLEYIVVHEMTHLLERNHGERFAMLTDGLMPDWRARREQLNASAQAAEEWGTATHHQARTLDASAAALGSSPMSAAGCQLMLLIALVIPLGSARVAG
jgi:predicted metal-dependent hydrolase